MDVDEANFNQNNNEDESEEQSLSPEATILCSFDDEQHVPPRIGDEYEAEIPHLMTKSDYISFTNTSSVSNFLDIDSCKFLIGLPISVMWITEKKDDIHERREAHWLVPGVLDDAWTSLEEASFLLGLYIFGKNFVEVKKFVETKETADILSFYYRKFYSSDKYRRWARCRKIRNSRRCIFGQKIFTGSRQQDLLSRLLPRVSEQCQITLLEVSKSFGEGKMSLEQYVSTLKAAVGFNALIEAVAIGKAKEDLTGISTEPLKSHQLGPARPEIPIGKACSTLTPLEIINFLTGGYRLSKTRSNDLFWEAVWPRLLARGWHSEQPNDNNCSVISKNSLVFLVPGVKKFSRRKLVKGNHYFDSVSDVLSKVASDPLLLEFEKEEKENGFTDDTNSSRHCYLKPRHINRCGADVIKFTVIDTSLAPKVRELRSLPVEMLKHSYSKNYNDDDSNSSEPTDDSDSTDDSSAKKRKLKRGKLNCVNGSEFSNIPVKPPRKLVKGHRRKPNMQHQGLATNESMIIEKPNPNVGSEDMDNVKYENLMSERIERNGGECTSNGTTKPELMFDLNVPIPQVMETDEFSFMSLVTRHNDDESRNKQEHEQPSSSTTRRHGTRNRPPTAKALEALAFGLFSSKPKRKDRDERPRRGRPKLRVTDDETNAVIDLTVEQGVDNTEFKGNGDVDELIEPTS